MYICHTRRRRRRGKSLKKSIPSRCLKPRATSLTFARTTSPCSLDFQVDTHFGDMTFSPSGCHVAPKVPASASSWYFLSIACLEMTVSSSVHAPAYVFGVKSSLTECVGMGDYRGAEPGGKLYGLYLPALPSTTVAHAPHLLGAGLPPGLTSLHVAVLRNRTPLAPRSVPPVVRLLSTSPFSGPGI